MNPLQGLLSVGIPLGVGALALLALGLRPRRDWLAFAGLVFPVGALATALDLFLCLSVGIDLRHGTPQLLLAGLAAVLAIPALKRWRRGSDALLWPRVHTEDAGVRPVRVVGWGVFAVLFALAVSDVLFALLQNWQLPIMQGDSATIWTMRARAIFHHGVFDAHLTDQLSIERGSHHLDYPLLGCLLQVWMLSSAALFGSEVMDTTLRWPTHLWHLSLVCCAFSGFSRRLGPLLGALLAWALVSLPELRLQGAGTMMDLTVCLAFFGLCDRLLRVHADDGSPENETGANLVLACAWAAILLWSKNEGYMLVLAAGLGAALGFSRARLRAALVRPQAGFALVPLLVIFLSVRFNARYGFTNDLMNGGAGRRVAEHLGDGSRALPSRLIAEFPAEIGETLRFYGELGLDQGRTGGLMLLFLFALVLTGRAFWRPPTRAAALAVCAAWVGYILVFIISYRELRWHLLTAGLRTSVHLFGATALVLSCVLRDCLLERPRLARWWAVPRRALARAPERRDPTDATSIGRRSGRHPRPTPRARVGAHEREL